MGKKNSKHQKVHKHSEGKKKLTTKEKKRINHLKLMQGGKENFEYEKQDWNKDNKENKEDKKKAA